MATALASVPRAQRSYSAKEFKTDLKPIWCPGCGDFGVLAALTKALGEVNVAPENVAVLTGIGCAGRLPGYVSSYGFNALHGRVLPLATGLKVTRLRPTIQMQMLLEFAPGIMQHGLIAGPFRSTQWTWVDARDVAAVGAAALRDPAHADQTYVITGSESLSYHQVAERLGAALGKSIRYTDITANEARGWLQAKGVPPVMIEAKLELWDACASNLINVAPTSVVKEVTGRDPRTLEDFARDYKESFGSY